LGEFLLKREIPKIGKAAALINASAGGASGNKGTDVFTKGRGRSVSAQKKKAFAGTVGGTNTLASFLAVV